MMFTTLKKKADFIVEKLKEIYPSAICSLVYEKPYELLIATRLSAQCTDARVNIVTPVLFGKYNTLESLALAYVDDVGKIIFSCGFWKIKSEDIVGIAKMLLSDFGGVVPDELDDLLKLPGVGRKTANLILGDVYHKGGIVTDTHCIRISNRLGLCSSDVPLKVERALSEIIYIEEQSDFCHRLVLFGREYCKSQNPACGVCVFRSDICEFKMQI